MGKDEEFWDIRRPIKLSQWNTSNSITLDETPFVVRSHGVSSPTKGIILSPSWRVTSTITAEITPKITSSSIDLQNASFYDQTQNISFQMVDNYTESNNTDIHRTFLNHTNNSLDIQKILECTDLNLDPDRVSLCVLLIFFAVATIFGNSLVIVAIVRERYLHTVTNYFIMSLAVADCLVGALVMPLSALYDSFGCWLFGPDFCDIWHSFDVLASTASILNLCVISMDRYWAITDPFSYPLKMSPKRAYGFIALVWVCAALISFPAIAWWRARSQPHPQFQCHFTEDLPYLFFSSTISFYGPLIVMVFTYFRIYRAATEQTRSLRLGQKLVSSLGDGDMELTLRIHRGGCNNSTYRRGPSYVRQNGYRSAETSFTSNDPELCNLDAIHGSSPDNSVAVVSRNVKHFSISRKLCKFAKEKKAAKTLGIVMGVFIVCWLPFFVNNLRLGLCGESCSTDSAYVTYIVTWLGWINSAMNPVIYACWARDFRRAFSRILCSCCPKQCRAHQNVWRNGIAQVVVTPVVSTLNTPFLKASASSGTHFTKVDRHDSA